MTRQANKNKMAKLYIAAYVKTMFFIAVIQIKKCTFCSVDSFNLLANHAGPFYEIHDSFIFSSVWQNRKSSGMLLQPKKSAIDLLIGLLLICGYIEHVLDRQFNAVAVRKQ